MKTAGLRFYEFGVFQVLPDERMLLRHGSPVHLPTRAFDTLLVLIKNASHLVGKSELMRAVWADTCVEEGNITLAISTLRKALGDDGNEHQYIETVPKHGYRFICDVREIVFSDRGLPAKTLEIRSLAVLPFISVHPSSVHDHLGLGIADALITKLARTGAIVVRPTSAVLKYSNAPVDVPLVGREQGVDAVLLGHIEALPEQIRVTAQLVRINDEALLWADALDESPQRILALEDELVNRVRRWLSISASANIPVRRPIRPDTQNPQAHRSYLEGRYFWNKRTEEGIRRSIECFQKATTEDPEYALAYAGLADSYVLLSSHTVGPTFLAYPVAKAAALRALQLDRSLAEPHASLGIVNFYYEWNLSEAEQEFQRAIALNPNYAFAHSWYGLNLAAMGRCKEALTRVRQAQELDPLSLQINTVAGRILYFQRQYDRSIDAYRKVIDLDPRYVRAHTRLGITYAAMGAFDDAIHEFEESQRLSSLDPYLAGYMGLTQALSGQTHKARKLLDYLNQHPHGAASVALIWIGLGKPDHALESLAKAHELHCSDMVYARTEPLLDPVRSDGRFTALLQQIGL